MGSFVEKLKVLVELITEALDAAGLDWDDLDVLFNLNWDKETVHDVVVLIAKVLRGAATVTKNPVDDAVAGFVEAQTEGPAFDALYELVIAVRGQFVKTKGGLTSWIDVVELLIQLIMAVLDLFTGGE